jgi:hypothetical protein
MTPRLDNDARRLPAGVGPVAADAVCDPFGDPFLNRLGILQLGHCVFQPYDAMLQRLNPGIGLGRQFRAIHGRRAFDHDLDPVESAQLPLLFPRPHRRLRLSTP